MPKLKRGVKDLLTKRLEPCGFGSRRLISFRVLTLLRHGRVLREGELLKRRRFFKRRVTTSRVAATSETRSSPNCSLARTFAAQLTYDGHAIERGRRGSFK